MSAYVLSVSFTHAPPAHRFARLPFGTTDAIIGRACTASGLSRHELLGEGRARHLAYPRFAVMAALRKLGKSTPQIGRTLGGRDHSTVISGLRRAAELRAIDPDFAALCAAVEGR